MRSQTRRLLATVGLIALLFASACGSTVQQSTEIAVGGTTRASGDIQGTISSSGGANATGTRGQGSSASSDSGAQAPGAAATAPAGSGPARDVPGITKDTIKIGVYTALAFNSTLASLGVKGVSTGSHTNQANAMAKYLNANGGIAGRKVQLVFHDKSATDSASVASQAACTAWTEDERVYAVVSPVALHEEGLYSCLAQRGVIVAQAGEVFDKDFFERYADHYYQPGDMNQTRTFKTVVDSLKEASFFGSTPRIAVLARDIPADHRAVDQGLKPALKAKGLALSENFFISSDPSASANSYASAVLRFKARGITHIIFGNLVSPILFGQAAESQQYRPRYALNSRTAPGALLQGNMPDAQLQGAMGPGWIPYEDVDTARDPGPPTKRAALCQKIMREAGEDTSIRATALIASWFCDMFFFVHDAVERADAFTPAAIRRAVESMGTSYEPASAFQATFAPGRPHDGASVYRLFAFDNGCRCFRYVGGPKPTA